MQYDSMKSSDQRIQYVKMNSFNFESAYQIQKNIWIEDPDYQCFYDKVMIPTLYDTCFLIYFGND